MKSMVAFTTRAYNSIDPNVLNGTITKRSREERLGNEILHYQSIPEQLKVWFPRYFDSGKRNEEYYLELELYSYQNLGRYLVGEARFRQQTPSEQHWAEVAKLIFSALQSFSKFKKNEDLRDHCNAMYVQKTLTEFGKLKQNFSTEETPYDSNQFPTVVLNGVEYLNFERLWDKHETTFKQILESDTANTFFHGDMCFSNILLGEGDIPYKVIKFVDPRGRFGDQIAYGDPYYDLAKLMHSTDVGYEYFIFDKFEVEKTKDNNFTLEYEQAENKLLVHKVFSKEIYSNFKQEKIKLIQGLIYIGMCARHYDSQKRQLAMYLSGVRTLNELVE